MVLRVSSSWSISHTRFTIVEEHEFTNQLRELGNLERIDDLLTGVYWALSTNPEVYGVLRGFKDVRLLKTDPLAALPAFRIWFRIDARDYQVHLMYLEEIAGE